jgi:hypothetical protein
MKICHLATLYQTDAAEMFRQIISQVAKLLFQLNKIKRCFGTLAIASLSEAESPSSIFAGVKDFRGKYSNAIVKSFLISHSSRKY